jgi:cobaltochelatase CobS
MEAIKYCINRFDAETKTSFLDLYTKIDAGIDPTTEVKSETNTMALDDVPF